MSENGFFKSIPGLITREKLQPNKRLFIFLVFIGIATFIWFLWSLEKDYTSIISNQVEYVGLPSAMVLVNELPTKIQMDVTGKGFALLRHNWNISKKTLQIDFKAMYGEALNINIPQNLVLSHSTIKTRLGAQLHNIIVHSVLPDSVSFRFAKMIKKTVPVLADLDLEFEKQYMLRGGIIIIPDSIEISGPSTILDTLKSVYTNPLKLKKVKKTIKKGLDLVVIHEKLSYSKKSIQLEVPVEQFTEKNLEVPVYGINIPDSLHLKLFPATTQLTFRVVVSEFEATQPENFILNVDYSNITEGVPARLSIIISQAPEYISNIKINPKTISYILENK